MHPAAGGKGWFQVGAGASHLRGRIFGISIGGHMAILAGDASICIWAVQPLVVGLIDRRTPETELVAGGAEQAFGNERKVGIRIWDVIIRPKEDLVTFRRAQYSLAGYAGRVWIDASGRRICKYSTNLVAVIAMDT